jgi:hypothetical protein
MAMNPQASQNLQQHLADADAVVVGTVTGVNLPAHVVQQLATPQPPTRGPISEHDPDWREATIQVASVEKGNVPAQQTVLFPASRDVAWYAAPKFHAGQKGIFVLHQREIPELQRTELVALHQEDYHPPEQLPQIMALMRAGG